MMKWINTDEYRPSERFLQFVAVNLQNNSTSPLSISLLRPFEVRDLILSLKRTNSVGTDGITSRFLRLAANVIASPMCEILNRSITECTFPALWKTARVIPVHKGSAKDNMNNYRPISLLCVMSKILEKHVYNNVISYFNRNKLLVDNQSGSRSNHSCQTGLTKLVNSWYNSMNAGEVIGCVTIDMRKAFD